MRKTLSPAILLCLAACSAGGGNAIANQAGDGPKPAPPQAPPDRCRNAADDEHCVDFLPATRMSGHWITGFESSGFIDAAATDGGADDPGEERIWLTFADGVAPDPALLAQRERTGGTAVIRIDFIGRRSRHPGHYGHLGGSERLVIVDRILATEFLGPLRR